MIGYVDSSAAVIGPRSRGISSAHDDIIERLAPRKTFEITDHTAPALWRQSNTASLGLHHSSASALPLEYATFRDVVSGDAAPARSRRLRDTEQHSAELAQRLSLSA